MWNRRISRAWCLLTMCAGGMLIAGCSTTSFYQPPPVQAPENLLLCQMDPVKLLRDYQRKGEPATTDHLLQSYRDLSAQHLRLVLCYRDLVSWERGRQAVERARMTAED